MAIYMWREYHFQPGSDAYIYLPLTSTTQLQNLGNGGITFKKVSSGTLTYDDLGVTFSNAGISSNSNVGQIAKPYTCSFWAKSQSSSSKANMFDYYESSNAIGFEIYYYNGKTYFSYGNAGSSDPNSKNVTISANTWHLYQVRSILEGTYKRIYMYVDGENIGYGTSASPNDYITIGCDYTSSYGSFLNGSVSDFFIYKEDLGEDNLLEYYNNTKSRYGIN